MLDKRETVSALLILTVILCMLRIIGVISWAWWWLIAPLWIVPACFLIVLLVSLVVSLVGILFIILTALVQDIENRGR